MAGELNSQARPLFILTPSLRIKRYANGRLEEISVLGLGRGLVVPIRVATRVGAC